MNIRMLKSVKNRKRKVNEEKVGPWHKIVRVPNLQTTQEEWFQGRGKKESFSSPQHLTLFKGRRFQRPWVAIGSWSGCPS